MARGAVLKYKTAKDLEDVGMAYIKKQEKAKAPILLTELCLALDLSIESLRAYEQREAYKLVVKKLKTYVMRDYERLLHGGKPVGAIFALKSISAGEFSDGGLLGGVGTGEMVIKWTTPKKK